MQSGLAGSRISVTIVISAGFRGAVLIRGEALIRGRRLFHCEYPKLQHLLEEETCLRLGAY